MELGWIGQYWTALDGIGMEWSVLDSIGLDSLDLTGLDWIGCGAG
jgi:hypothetical protein